MRILASLFGASTRVLLVSLVLLCLAALWFGVTAVAEGSAELPPDVKALTTQVEYLEKRASQLQVLLGALLAVNVLYAAALAVGTYLNLKSVVDKAREDQKEAQTFARDMRDNLIEFRNEIRADLPALQNMDKALNRILHEIRDVLPIDRDWGNAAYFASLREAEKEQILYAERTVAGFRFFDLAKVAAFRATVSEIHRALGQYYGAAFAASLAEKSLCARALLYLEEALRANPDNASAYKDMGVLWRLAGPAGPEMQASKDAFLACLRLEPGHPGGLFGHGWHAYNDGRFLDAIQIYSQLIAKSDWRDLDKRKYLPDAYLNRACTEAKGAADPVPAPVWNRALNDCLAGLVAARELGVEADYREHLRHELQQGGDLERLRRDRPGETDSLV